MARITLPVGDTIGRTSTVNIFEENLTIPSSISWRSVVAGVVVALTTSIILNLIGMGIGFSTIDPATGDTPGIHFFAILTAIWYVGTAIVSSFAGGWTASYLSNRVYGYLGAWHGLVTWAVSTLIIVYLVSTAIGSMVSGTMSAIGGAAQTAAVSAAPAAAESNPFDNLDSQVRAYTGNDPRALSDVATHNIRLLATGNPADADELRAKAVTAAMRANNMNEEQARNYVAQLEQEYRQTAEQVKAKAAEATEATAKTVSRISILAALTLIFGALAGWIGGNFATVNRADVPVNSRRD